MVSDAQPQVCGEPMGGIWVPVAGVPSYHPLTCNGPATHPPGQHSWLDPASGKLVIQLRSPSLQVDGRGCVHEAAT